MYRPFAGLHRVPLGIILDLESVLFGGRRTQQFIKPEDLAVQAALFDCSEQSVSELEKEKISVQFLGLVFV